MLLFKKTHRLSKEKPAKNGKSHKSQKNKNNRRLPSRELTYPPKMACLKMIFLFPRWDMLISWRVNLEADRIRQGYRETFHWSSNEPRYGKDVDLAKPWLQQNWNLGGGFKYFLFSSLFGEDYHFD